MLSANEAKKLHEECVRKRLEERLTSMIQEACERGENFIMVELTIPERTILQEAGYTVKSLSGSTCDVSWG